MGVVGYYGPNVVSSGNTGGGSSSGGPSNDSGGFIGEGWGGNPPEEPAPSPLTWGPSQAVEDEYDEPDPVHEAQTQADINAIIQNMQEAGTYTATPPPTTPKVVKGTAAEVLVAEAQAAADAAAQENTLINTIMGGGVGGLLGVLKPQFQQPGKHKLRAQYDYLRAKYGPAWANTTQAKSLANYLSGVPVEQGGGLGALDSSYGTGEKIDPTDKAEIYRQEILDKMMYGGGGHSALDYLKSDYYDAELAKQGLTPEQYFNFRQQLMAADPSLGNVDYKEAFPLSSGSGVAALASPALSITKDILGIESVAPAEYQENIGQTFYDTSTPEYGGGGGGQGGGGGAGISGFAGISPLPGLVEDNLANIPAEVAAATVPAEVAAATEPTPFDYSQWPQFTSAYPGYNQYPWPNYVNQGLGQWPQFNYWNQIANAFPGMS